MRTYQKHGALSMMSSLPCNSLPIPLPSARQRIEIPCGRTGIRSQAIDFRGNRESFSVISLLAGKFVTRLDTAAKLRMAEDLCARTLPLC
jgi:hypothetical protein